MYSTWSEANAKSIRVDIHLISVEGRLYTHDVAFIQVGGSRHLNTILIDGYVLFGAARPDALLDGETAVNVGQITPLFPQVKVAVDRFRRHAKDSRRIKGPLLRHAQHSLERSERCVDGCEMQFVYVFLWIFLIKAGTPVSRHA